MRIFIAGIDGYIGWPLACHLAERGDDVCGVDNFLRRQLVEEDKSRSIIPIRKMESRIDAHRRRFGRKMMFMKADCARYPEIARALVEFMPDVVVNLAHMPSAPFSMRNPAMAAGTITNNVNGMSNLLWAMREFLPGVPLLTLGTMGEYGTPGVRIPEEGPDRFPRQPGSWYHGTKCAMSTLTELATRVWGLGATDVMQGVVYGTRIDAIEGTLALATRLDADECFGTVINRFVCQAIAGQKLTIYGKGGQTRGYLPLRDSIQCLTLAIDNPPEDGEYRVFNQIEETYSVNDLAEAVKKAVPGSESIHVENPRVEQEEHFYEVEAQRLLNLGYRPHANIDGTLAEMVDDLEPHVDVIRKLEWKIRPMTRWVGKHQSSERLQEA